MSEISIIEVKKNKDLMKFIKFPMVLYKNNKNYVPALIIDEVNTWDPKKNAALNHCEVKKYLAYKNAKIVGRIALIINNELNEKKLRFGWFDFIDDQEVSEALIKTAISFAKEKKLKKIEGPMGFTNLDKAGMLIMGYDKLATIIGLYNYDYYPKHLEKMGLVKEKEWVEFEITFPEVLPEKVEKFSKLIAEKYKLKVIDFKNKKELLPLVEPMFKLLDETYKPLSTYTPITDEQIKTYKEKYFGFFDKDYVVCVVDEHNDLISFAITMPSYSEALQKAKGKLFPFGWYYLWKAGKRNSRANFYLIGIHPDYQRRGVTSIIFKKIWENFTEKGIKFLETNPELEENKNIQLLWQDYNPVNHKKRITYSKEI